jgi:SAM-dependent methyltransferase
MRTMTSKREWFDQEDFWRATYPFMFGPARFEAADEEVGQLLRLIRRRRGAVLDLCCGPGRHAVALAKRGFKVTGVDVTPFLLNKARKRARDEKVSVEFVRADMRDFVRPNAYDVVLSLFTSFGYFDHKDEDKRVLQHLHQSLRPRGVAVVDVMAKERIAAVLQPASATQLADGTLLVERREIFDDWTRIRNEWTVIKGGQAKTFKFHHTLYSGQELRILLEQAGFADVRLYGHLDGRAFGPGTPRLVAVARK